MASPRTAASLRHQGPRGHAPASCRLPLLRRQVQNEMSHGSNILHMFLLRKKKAVHKTVITDDKRLQSMLKRVGVNTFPTIEEVNIFKDDLAIQFLNPKVKK
ncbi:hypothetical protein ZWY2020_037642 [Hordeum vulgare]|nr:hypothetical protein ZWY2020_037642 [Hordeum vulgare]